MKKMINQFRKSIWVYPVVYSLFSLTLSIVITLTGRLYADQMADYIPRLFYTTTALAQSVLTIAAGAFITIVTFTFSTTMVVLTMYSSQFTPRVIENFLNNKTTMKSFGVFLSGFIFAITSLLFINTNVNEDGNLVIVASLGVVYVIVGIIYFLIFIHSVASHIQASDLILRIQEEALKTIAQYCDSIKQAEVIPDAKRREIIDDKYFIDVFGGADGYIQEIDYLKLKKIAGENDCTICLNKVVGQFITTETRILRVYYEGLEGVAESVIQAIQQCIGMGNKKSEVQDFSFSIQKIVEIAIKALSPGINDPNTATHFLNIIGALLRDLAEIEKGYIVLKDDIAGQDPKVKGLVLYEAYDFEILLYDAYNQIMFYGESDATVMVAGFRSLRFIKANASPKNRQLIDEYARQLLVKMTSHNYGELEFRKIQNEYQYLTDLTNQRLLINPD